MAYRTTIKFVLSFIRFTTFIIIGGILKIYGLINLIDFTTDKINLTKKALER